MFWHREMHINPQRNWTDKISWTKQGSNLQFLQTEGTPPAAICLMPQTLCQKHNPICVAEDALDNWQPVWNAHILILTSVCVDFELRSGSADIHICLDIHKYMHSCLLLILMLWCKQAILDSKGDKLSSSAECRIRSWEVWDTKSPAQTYCPLTNRLSYRGSSKNLNLTASPHDDLTSLPIGFRTDALAQASDFRFERLYAHLPIGSDWLHDSLGWVGPIKILCIKRTPNITLHPEQ